MKRKYPAETDYETLVHAGRIEIEKAKGHFEDIDVIFHRVLAIQWMLDQGGDDSELGLHTAIQEMIDELLHYQEMLEDKGTEAYEDLIESSFFEQVEIEFTKEALDRSFGKME